MTLISSRSSSNIFPVGLSSFLPNTFSYCLIVYWNSMIISVFYLISYPNVSKLSLFFSVSLRNLFYESKSYFWIWVIFLVSWSFCVYKWKICWWRSLIWWISEVCWRDFTWVRVSSMKDCILPEVKFIYFSSISQVLLYCWWLIWCFIS